MINFKHNEFNIAFTLIELLVVIAIVGILSGLIIVGMSSSIDNANIAKAQIFATSLRNSLLANLVAEWKFDQVNVPASNQTPDSWGSNNGTLVDAGGACSSTLCPQLQTTGCIYDKCLSFNGTGAYVNVPHNNNLNMSNSVSMDMWIYPYNATAGYTFLLKKQTPGYDLGLSPSGTVILEVFYYYDTEWRYNSCGSATHLVSNKFYHLAATFSQNNFLKVYINGKLDAQCSTSYSSPAGSNTNALVMGYQGWMGSGNAYYNGVMDNVRLYSAVIPASQIKEDYYAGLNNIFAKGEITEEEYQNKIKELVSSI